MIFRKKSKLDKILDAFEAASVLVGATRPKRRFGKLKRVQRSAQFITLVAPILWANRDRMKKAVDAALREGQKRLDAGKQALKGGGGAGQAPEQPQQQASEAQQGQAA